MTKDELCKEANRIRDEWNKLATAADAIEVHISLVEHVSKFSGGSLEYRPPNSQRFGAVTVITKT